MNSQYMYHYPFFNVLTIYKMKKNILYFAIPLLVLTGLASCSPAANTDSDETTITEEVDQTPVVDEAVVDSIENKMDEMESELDDIMDGLE